MYKERNFINLGTQYTDVYLKGVCLSEYRIIINAKNSMSSQGPLTLEPNEEFASRELQKYLGLICGCPIPVVSDKNPQVCDYEIILGNCVQREKINVELGVDEYLIKTIGTRLYILGGKRGILYGVYNFLENYLGVRFFTQDIEKIIYKGRIDLGDIDDRQKPAFRYREPCQWNAWDPDYSVKRAFNGGFVRKLDDAHGNGLGFAGGVAGLVHTFEGLCPKEEYMHDHPEYYALDEHGVRRHMGLCVTNEGTLNAVVEHARKMLKESNEKLISISINDGDVPYCHCEECSKLNQVEGDYAAQVVYFVCKVADALRDEFPDVKFDTIVYGKVQVAPKGIKIPDNVSIRLCGTGTRSECYDTSEEFGPKSFREKLKSWGAICNGLTVWDYPDQYLVINSFYPIFHTHLRNFRYMAENNVDGIFINGNSDCPRFYDLSVYLYSKLFWNPYVSEEEYDNWINEFMQASYGKNWNKVRGFFDFIHEQTKGKVFGSHVLPQELIDPFMQDNKGNKVVNKKLIAKMHKFFDDARKGANSAEKYRIGKEELQLDYWELFSTMDFILENGTKQEQEEVIEKNKKLYYNLNKYGILRVVGNWFLQGKQLDPRQSPVVWGDWDAKAIWGEVNDFGTDKDLYLFFESELPVGTKIDFDVDFKTCNSGKGARLEYLNSNGTIVEYKGENSDALVWDNFKNYKTLSIKDAVVTKLENFAKADGKPMKEHGYRFIPDYRNVVILKLKDAATGASVFISNPQIKQK